MEKLVSIFYMFFFFQIFDGIIALPGPRGKAVIVYLSQMHYYYIIVGKFHSNLVLFSVVVCYTRILNYTNGKLAIRRLLKQTVTFVQLGPLNKTFKPII